MVIKSIKLRLRALECHFHFLSRQSGGFSSFWDFGFEANSRHMHGFGIGA
jgi:hypothetical protein